MTPELMTETLLDTFAGLAMQQYLAGVVILNRVTGYDANEDSIAKYAYAVARAMLDARMSADNLPYLELEINGSMGKCKNCKAERATTNIGMCEGCTDAWIMGEAEQTTPFDGPRHSKY